VITDGAAACACPAGSHLEGASCVPDTTCSPTTCTHGTCDDGSGTPVCTCEVGFTGLFCDACDAVAGYHPDGAGGCTLDACVPNPCTALHQTLCSVDAMGVVICACEPGYHADVAGCVLDEVCTPSTCANGTCAVSMGRATCTCDLGWAGADCSACDEAAGYHDDGAGDCTLDACLPNPCTVPGRTVCSEGPSGPLCACDAGTHEDGLGGCTSDPCRPDPCGPLETCRDVGGVADCYVPVCDDGNPCTVDTNVGGVCQHASAANGTSCSTSICRAAEVCSGGVCGGGSPVSCNDGNPCTRDACVDPSGCSFSNDDTLVPSDGASCTIDSCRLGVASHVPSNAVCDDGLFCSGTEVCAPTESGADVRGCRTTPRTPPGGAPACNAYVCSESTDDFTLTPASTGASCDDGRPCTTGDRCSAGACAGTPTAACGLVGGCMPTSLGAALDIDLSPTRVTGRLTYEGSTMFPNSSSSNTVSYWLRDDATGIHHYLESVGFDSSGILTSYGLNDDRMINREILPGTYDLVYRRFSSSGTYLSGANEADPYPSAERVVRTVTIAGPTATLDIDLAPTRVTGRLTYEGSTTFPNSSSSNTVSYWLRDNATGIHHYLESVGFDSSGILTSYGLNDDRMINREILPGTYDLVYRRFSSSGTYLSGANEADPYPSAERVVRTVTIAGPTATLDIDLAPTRVTGRLTYEASTTFPNSSSSNTVSYWLRDNATGIHHYLESVGFDASGILTSYGLNDDRMINREILPGTYDLVYRRFSSSGTYLSGANEADPYPSAERVVRTVTIAGPTATLDIDLAPTRVTGRLTYEGSTTFPDSSSSNTVSYWLRDNATGIHHYLESVGFNSSGVLTSYGLNDDRMIDREILPGTYDLIYRRFSSSGTYLSGANEADPYPSAERVLRTVSISGPAATLDIDLAPTRVTGRLTYGGATTFPDSSSSNTVSYWLRDNATGIHHYVESVGFNSSGILTSYGLNDDRMINREILPGTYDLIYRRFSSSGTYLSGANEADPYPSAEHLVRGAVVIAGSTATLDIDLIPVRVGGTLTYDGSTTFPNSSSSNTVSYWLRDDATGIHHYVESVGFNSSGVLMSYGPNDDRVVNRPLLPGAYDLVYRRFSSSGTYLSGASEADPYPSAEHLVRACVVVE
jgi:hypothetical protein